MEALQTLKFSLKKEQFNFTGGWQMVLSKMKRMRDAGTTKDLLVHLLTGDHQATTDALLHMLLDSNDEDEMTVTMTTTMVMMVSLRMNRLYDDNMESDNDDTE